MAEELRPKPSGYKPSGRKFNMLEQTPEGLLFSHPGSAEYRQWYNRAAKLFDGVVLAVASSSKKKPMFSHAERIKMAQDSLVHIPGVTVLGFNKLLTHFLDDIGETTVLRGLRAVSDFEYEFQLAGMNRKLSQNIETIFLMSDVENQIISSRFVKEIVKLKGDIKKFTTKSTIKSLKDKYE
mgnify:CR=1 FL=1